MSSDSLGTNKILGAVLATGLVILGLRQVSDMTFTTEPPAKAGYAVEVQADTSGEAAEPADTPPDWGTVLPKADVNAGMTISTKCASCHNFANGGPNMTGPNLYGVIGRKPGTHPGFDYSSAMQGFGAKTPVWDYDHLYMFLGGPQAYLNGTKMTFVGLKKPQDRIDLIAWLRQQSASPVPIPAPNPKAAAPAGTGAPNAAPKADTTVAAGPQAPVKPVAAPTGTPGNATAAAAVGTAPPQGSTTPPASQASTLGGKKN